MEENQHIWKNWSRILHRWGMDQVVAIILEAVGPLNFLGAQAVYLGQPILNFFFPEDHLNALASILDNPDETKAFTTFLLQQQWVD